MSDIPKHLRCTDCGIGRPIGGSLHTAAECRDNLRDALNKAEAEVARLRGEYERGLREAAGVLRDAAKKHRNEADASRSVAASGGHVLAADILESYANAIELLDAKEGGG